MRKYTEAIHARRLLQMLKKTELCDCCPARKGFILHHTTKYIDLYRDEAGKHYHESPICTICRNFISIPLESTCPCYYFQDANEAIEQTLKALKEKGYLK